MKPPKRMGFNCAFHPTGAFVLRVVGATTQVFATPRDAAAFLREAADWIDTKRPDKNNNLYTVRWWHRLMWWRKP